MKKESVAVLDSIQEDSKLRRPVAELSILNDVAPETTANNRSNDIIRKV